MGSHSIDVEPPRRGVVVELDRSGNSPPGSARLPHVPRMSTVRLGPATFFLGPRHREFVPDWKAARLQRAAADRAGVHAAPASRAHAPATALLNEAFIKQFDKTQPEVANRAHLLALMSRVMRQVLVDHARAGAAAKRGGGGARAPWDTNIEIGSDRAREPLNPNART